MKTRIVICLAGIVLFAGCVTYPSQLTDLGEETSSPTVSGSAMYVGFFGAGRAKDKVYEEALKKALLNGGTSKLSDVKMWETYYTSASMGAVLIAGMIPLLIVGFDDTNQIAIATIIAETLVLLASGLDVRKYTVVGVPVE